VDDFGTGYSSMSYLRRFPIDKLKIDREFVKEMTTRAEDASIVRAMVSLAHSLNLKVVAEGVETPEQLAFLQQLRCDQYQGFLFSPAIAAVDFQRLLTSCAQDPELDLAATQSRLAPLKP
jgi:EAL domain-containing protein (putative c-di-GMP-specific phosphodiesterase class I)